ncbi:hypothetical protein BJX65DRAFT_309890 [Aspergillus insuetus]
MTLVSTHHPSGTNTAKPQGPWNEIGNRLEPVTRRLAGLQGTMCGPFGEVCSHKPVERWSALETLCTVGAIGDAIHGRLPFSHPDVVVELNTLFAPEQLSDRWDLIQEYENNLPSAYIKAVGQLKRREAHMFRDQGLQSKIRSAELYTDLVATVQPANPQLFNPGNVLHQPNTDHNISQSVSPQGNPGGLGNRVNNSASATGMSSAKRQRRM